MNYITFNTEAVSNAPGSWSAEIFESLYGGKTVSIVRIGLAETKKFAAGYESIFGKKKEAAPKKGKTATAGKKKKGKKKA